MKLYEFLAKEIFNKYQIPVPIGKVATNPEQISDIISSLGPKVVLKAQVQVGGRGKAGGIKVVNKEDAVKTSKEMFGQLLKGFLINYLLVENALNIEKEYYLGITVDRAVKKVVIMLSAVGGVDIEEIAAKTPEKLIKIYVNPSLGLMDFQLKELLYMASFDANASAQIKPVILQLYKIFNDYDCSLAEINPLVLTKEGQIYAVDGKMDIDDNAIFRQAEIVKLKISDQDPLETKAKEAGLSYVKLDGDIGCVVNGAGLAMATMDSIKHAGGNPANFLDIGGSSNPAKVTTAMEILLSNPNLKAVLFNIFGGITRCDDVATGLVSALKSMDVKVPLVIRLTGTNEEQAIKILKDANLSATKSMKEAVEQVVKL